MKISARENQHEYNCTNDCEQKKAVWRGTSEDEQKIDRKKNAK